MKIQQKVSGPAASLELNGDLDFHTSPELRKTFQSLFEQKVSRITVNLKKVKYIDSSGLATFVEALQKIKHSGGELILTETGTAVRSVFEIAKLDKVFTLSDSNTDPLRPANL